MPYSPAYAAQSPVYSNPSLLGTHQVQQVANVHSPSYSPSSMAFKTESGRIGMMPPVGQSIYSPSYTPVSAARDMSGSKSIHQNSYYMPANSSPVIKFENSSQLYHNMSATSAIGKSPAYNPQPYPFPNHSLSARDPNKIKEEPHDSASESD